MTRPILIRKVIYIFFVPPFDDPLSRDFLAADGRLDDDFVELGPDKIGPEMVGQRQKRSRSFGHFLSFRIIEKRFLKRILFKNTSVQIRIGI